MANTVTLTNHEEIRDWAAGRAGHPAIVDVSPEAGIQPLLRIVFGEESYEDVDRPERPPNSGGYDLVEWDDWFEIFDRQELALVVAEEQPGLRDSSYEIVRLP